MSDKRETQNDPRDHHYAPQLYLRRFACSDDANKVEAIWRHEPIILRGRRSISGIGFEEDLHTIKQTSGDLKVERLITEGIETPLTETETWQKILAGDVNALTGAEDRLNLYLFAAHLKSQTLEQLRFIEDELARIQQNGFPQDYTDAERELYTFLGSHPDNPKKYFLAMATNVRRFVADLNSVSIIVVKSPLRLRSSTLPVLIVPLGVRDALFPAEARCAYELWWLPLDPHFGILVRKGAGFSGIATDILPSEVAQLFNRLYIMQLTEGISVRYCLADDSFVDEDLAWANFGPPTASKGRVRYARVKSKEFPNWLDQAWANRGESQG